MDFKQWMILSEVSDSTIATYRGAELFKDPAMEVAMYMLYRQAYDPISSADREEEINHHMTNHGIGREEAEGMAKSSGKAWSHGEWTKPSSGGTRSPEWVFSGIFPNESDLEIIRQSTQGIQGYNKSAIQQIADQLLAAGQPALKECGGLSYRDDSPEVIKLTGTWGANTTAKMRSAAAVIHKANTDGRQIFTGADSKLKELIDRANDPNGPMGKFHKKGMVPSPTLGLSTPPKEVIPLLYDVIVSSPSANSGGQWTGYNADTGALKINLAGSGQREKFIYGNKPMWQKSITQALNKSGFSAPAKLQQAKSALDAGGFMAQMASQQINKVLKQSFPNAPDVPATGLSWLLNQV
jgi:hypothetical protein